MFGICFELSKRCLYACELDILKYPDGLFQTRKLFIKSFEGTICTAYKLFLSFYKLASA